MKPYVCSYNSICSSFPRFLNHLTSIISKNGEFAHSSNFPSKLFRKRTFRVEAFICIFTSFFLSHKTPVSKCIVNIFLILFIIIEIFLKISFKLIMLIGDKTGKVNIIFSLSRLRTYSTFLFPFLYSIDIFLIIVLIITSFSFLIFLSTRSTIFIIKLRFVVFSLFKLHHI